MKNGGSRSITSFSDVWRPMVAFPGPRSVQLRPEPFVFPRRLLTASTDEGVTPGLSLLNYDNRLLSVKKWIVKSHHKRSLRAGGLGAFKSDSYLTQPHHDRLPTAQSHHNMSKLPIPRVNDTSYVIGSFFLAIPMLGLQSKSRVHADTFHLP